MEPAWVSPQEPATRSRSGAVIALGVIQIILGGLCALGVLVALVMSSKMSGRGAGGQGAAALFYFVAAANLLVTGIGSVMFARWARLATIISAAVWLALGVLALVAFLFVAMSSPRRFGMGKSEGMMLMVVGVPLVLILVGLPLTLLIVYTRPNVKATFERRNAGAI
jgi:hypothetical protein